MEKKWIITIIVSVIAFLLFVFGLLFVRSQFAVIKYGTPNYRPRIE